MKAWRRDNVCDLSLLHAFVEKVDRASWRETDEVPWLAQISAASGSTKRLRDFLFRQGGSFKSSHVLLLSKW